LLTFARVRMQLFCQQIALFTDA